MVIKNRFMFIDFLKENKNVVNGVKQLTEKIQLNHYEYGSMEFYFSYTLENKDRVYVFEEDYFGYKIITAPSDYDGVLIGIIDPALREGTDDDDDLIRYFDCETGEEIIW